MPCFLTVKDHLARGAVGDASTVEGKDKSLVRFQVQFLSERRDTIGGAPRCENDAHALLFCFQQRVACAWCHLFLTISQRAVEIEHDHLVVHVRINMCYGETERFARSILSFRKVTLRKYWMHPRIYAVLASYQHFLCVRNAKYVTFVYLFCNMVAGSFVAKSLILHCHS